MSDSKDFELSSHDRTPGSDAGGARASRRDEEGEIRADENRPSPGAARSVRGGHDNSVITVIASLEQQLQQIRAAHLGSQQELATLEERWSALERAEQTVASDRDSLERERIEITEQRSHVESQHRDLEAREQRVADDEAALEEVRKLLEDEQQSVNRARTEMEAGRAAVEEDRRCNAVQRQEIEQERERVEARAAELEERSRELHEEAEGLRRDLERAEEQAQSALAARARIEDAQVSLSHRVEQAERNVGDLIVQLEASQEELDRKIAAASALEHRIDQLDSEAARLMAELDSARTRVDEVETEGIELAKQVEAERDGALADLRQREKAIEAIKANVTALREANDALQSEVDAVRAEREEAVAERDARISELESDLSERAAIIESQEATLETARCKLAEFASAISEQAGQIQQGAAAMAEVREHNRTIERLKQQLAQAKMAADPGELARKDERIAELTEALHQSRGQSVPDDDIVERDSRIESLENELDAIKRQHEHAKIELQEARSELDARREEQAHAEVAPLEARVRELEAELAKAQSSSRGVDRDSELAKENKRKAIALKEAAHHLLRRRERLARAKRLIRQKAHALEFERTQAPAYSAAPALPARMSADQREELMRIEAKIREEQTSLREASRALAQSERAMVKRWARPRAVVTLTWLMVLTVIVAVASWFAADHFYPAMRSVSVTLVAEPRPGIPATEDQIKQWQAWHEAVLEDDAFMRTASKRFGDRRFDELKDPFDLKKHLTHNLSTDSTRLGELTLTLAGADAEKSATTLDLLTLTVLGESRRQAGQRSDGLRTTVKGASEGQVEWARVNSIPVRDDRLTHTGIIFAGSILVSIVLLGLIYAKLARARRIFDQEADINLLQAISS